MTICVIQIFALLPAIDLGIFVITLLLSTVTVEVTPVGKDAEVKVEGTVKFLGAQSSIKKPMVGANVGSTCGLTVVVSMGFGGVVVSFLPQYENIIVVKNKLAIKLNPALVIIADLFITAGVLKYFFYIDNFVAGRRIGPQHYCQN